MQLESTLGQIEALRSELRLRADGLGDGQLVRGAGVMSWLAGGLPVVTATAGRPSCSL